MSVIRAIAVFLCGGLVSGAFAQVMTSGWCPSVTVKQNFKPTQYLGKWYEYARAFAAFELHGKCVTAEYSDKGDNSIKVINAMINSKTNVSSKVEGVAKLVSEDGEAKLTVQFPRSPVPGPYWVLDTDYKSYTVVWGCTDIALFNMQFAWILTRDRHPTEEVINKAYSVLDDNHIERTLLTVTDQKDC